MRVAKNFKTIVGILMVSLGWVFLSLGDCIGQQFPSRPITIIINYAAGGATDIAVRPMAKITEKKLGVPVVISNRPGGGGTIGMTELARSKPDGYTLGTVTIGAAIVVPMMQKVSYNALTDFEYICGFGSYIYGIFTRTDSRFKTMQDVVREAKANPGKVTYGTMSPSIAIGLKYVEIKENIRITYIPYQSGTEAVANLVGGHVDLCIASAPETIKFIEGKEIRALAAVATERWAILPDVPTMKDLGYDIDITGWMAMGTPAGVSKEHLSIFYDAFKFGHADPEVKELHEKLYSRAPYISGEEVKKIYSKRQVEWKPLIDSLASDQKKK